ncbi:MAG: cob(I)yrinic acid a,c-diamide adenosyltransferase [Candidatus Raymondbacteria bacterium RifOxyA12_full_50_37]|uniref:Cob(I)yrinic acid a,c-diamide adenosyltransferase n=1 Tax=Candidatus Raymondbacteria bacterium RIFOXYD12_FULL_49_13 TaxID=1817890 RepID=A0A1F7FHT2_UNCRA|nr:MAG: cob(I)yrinic acid a,c-diamide adenosyltransferase [Candidatus Raymondbacteria bacterium RifOxyA12_full_50_37]OGJ87485.1 MAG: cob(I)yrinic acid a,c-diamide adenosyltransferase [Candidatus Raymondbacteria bacterium RIFOXYA2_FULL_49_16]OGJ96425.1 MAG: cob(I)yrinic acid a,c-diamide adenosyltransferase [Candidatus Raymondbacteria bacterium RIFOXYC2_FULL_50_21]OGK03566.1 MAG: cob(I)yrinic acid a,c-diamide adenosyltransferase [Candidatus Raymondbacteria bacterium RifOxyB12_full_50_8]OGK06168.1
MRQGETGRGIGYVHVYTGNGKGKTTAALGLALRASGAGKRVLVAQFLKGRASSEHTALKQLKNIAVQQFGGASFIVKKPSAVDCRCARKGLKTIERAIGSGTYDLVILDEAAVAVYFGLFSEVRLLEIIKNRPAYVEIVVTGRKASKRLIGAADLVTEMKEVKHYFHAGVGSRKGIED